MMNISTFRASSWRSTRTARTSTTTASTTRRSRRQTTCTCGGRSTSWFRTTPSRTSRGPRSPGSTTSASRSRRRKSRAITSTGTRNGEELAISHTNRNTRVSNDRRPGRLVDLESVVEFNILVGRLLNHSQQDGPTGFGTGNGTMKQILMT